MILDDIVAKKRVRLEKVSDRAEIFKKAESLQRSTKSLAAALSKEERAAIIAEVKKASPSRGLIRPDFSHTDIAKAYLKSDVQAMSVLTEEDFFLGKPEYLKDIAAFSDIPLLRKDFIIDEYQIYEAYLLGADAILLIAAILDDKTLLRFSEIAHSLGLECLFEAHDEEEIKRISAVGAKIIGINNRNLKDFSEDIHTTERLLKFLPKGAVSVSESSIKTAEDIKYLESIGVCGVLIGERFMREDDIFSAVERIRGR
jgi:indole-3-glycerol phosphate synthase